MSGVLGPRRCGSALGGPAGNRAVRRQLTQRVADHRNVIGGGVASRIAGPQQHRQRLPGPRGAVVGEGPQRMEAIAPLEGGPRLFLVAVGGDQGRVRSMTSGVLASAAWSGAWLPARDHTLARACARAVSMAASARGASAANASMVRDT